MNSFSLNHLRNQLFDWATKIFLTLLMIASIGPFIWMILNSFKTNDEIYTNPIGLPETFNFDNFVEAWILADFNTVFVNSFVYTATTVTLVLVLSSFAAFALARMTFKGRFAFLFLFVGAQVVSREVVLVPMFSLFRGWGVLDTLTSIILANAVFAIPLSVFLLWGFFRDIPTEIEESTKIDGASSLTFFFKMLIPLSKPVLATVTIFQSLSTWNDYLFALTFLRSPEVLTIPLSLQVFFVEYGTQWSKLFSALTLAVLPVIILYLFLQKYFISGLTAGAVKG